MSNQTIFKFLGLFLTLIVIGGISYFLGWAFNQVLFGYGLPYKEISWWHTLLVGYVLSALMSVKVNIKLK